MTNPCPNCNCGKPMRQAIRLEIIKLAVPGGSLTMPAVDARDASDEIARLREEVKTAYANGHRDGYNAGQQAADYNDTGDRSW